MSIWALLLGFAAGWASCWYFGKFVLRHVLRRPEGSVTADAIAGLKQESLLKFRNAVEDELEKRRSS